MQGPQPGLSSDMENSEPDKPVCKKCSKIFKKKLLKKELIVYWLWGKVRVKVIVKGKKLTKKKQKTRNNKNYKKNSQYLGCGGKLE